MVISRRHNHRSRAFLMVELVVVIAILMLALLPIAYGSRLEAQAFRGSYQRAVAMEIVDGEMEILAAGEWRAQPEGTHPYAIQAAAAQNLPPGSFLLTRTGNHLRLEWSATEKQGIGTVSREVTVP